MSETDTPETSPIKSPPKQRRLSLDEHLIRVDVLKIGLRNSFGINFRSAARQVRCDDHSFRSERFHYLGEVFPFIESQVAALSRKRRRAYETLKEHAEESFWEIYSDFQPMVQSIASASGIESGQVDPVLGRAILLFDACRRTKFVTYLEKTLRESVKNLRGQRYAAELGLPLSAGRLVPQMRWVLDQAAMQSGYALSPEDSDRVIVEFLTQHRSKFSVASMQQIAEVMRRDRRAISLDFCADWLEPSAGSTFTTTLQTPVRGNDCFVELHDEIEHQLKQIQDSMCRAGFNKNEVSLVLHHLGLAHDEQRYHRVAAKVTTTSLRKRTHRLLVRLMAARYASQAPRFGSFLRSTPAVARDGLRQTVDDCAADLGCGSDRLVDELMNWMSLSDSVYRVSITERGRLATYLSKSQKETLQSATFQKLKAALIEQERLGFPCWSDA